MQYVNFFVQDVMDLFQNRMIRIRENSVIVDEEALYLLGTAYKMSPDDVLFFLQKVIKFAEIKNG